MVVAWLINYNDDQFKFRECTYVKFFTEMNIQQKAFNETIDSRNNRGKAIYSLRQRGKEQRTMETRSECESYQRSTLRTKYCDHLFEMLLGR